MVQIIFDENRLKTADIMIPFFYLLFKPDSLV